MASSIGKRSIFDTIEQWMDIDPSKIRLQQDRVLLRDIPEEERHGSLYLPEVCRNQEKIRRGIVIAVGPGDSKIERAADQHDVHPDGYVRTKARRVKCRVCDGSIQPWDAHWSCQTCKDTRVGRLPMSVRPGDRVLYSQRQEAEIFINHQRYGICHEEQAIIGIWDTTISERIAIPRMLRDRILVSRDAIHQKIGAIHIPQGAQEERPEGRVVAVGPGKLLIDGRFQPPDVKVGDHIVFDKGRGADIKIKGERFLILREDDVYGVLNG